MQQLTVYLMSAVFEHIPLRGITSGRLGHWQRGWTFCQIIYKIRVQKSEILLRV